MDKVTECPMCRAGIIGRNATKEITLGVPGSLEKAVMFFKMTPLEVQEHCTNHEIMVDEEEGKYESNDFYMDRLLKVLKRLDAWVKYLDAKSLDRESISLGLKLMKETRETMKDLAEFQGRLDRRGNVSIQIDTLNAQYNELQQVILQGLCPECQEMVIKQLSMPKTSKHVSCVDVSSRILESGS
jgi:hypothetical protein